MSDFPNDYLEYELINGSDDDSDNYDSDDYDSDGDDRYYSHHNGSGSSSGSNSGSVSSQSSMNRSNYSSNTSKNNGPGCFTIIWWGIFAWALITGFINLLTS